MPVETGDYDNGIHLEDGRLVAELDDGTWLISATALDADDVLLSEIDSEPGRVRFHEPPLEDDDPVSYRDMTFDTFRMARLAFGLWDRCGPFSEPEGAAVPVKVATDGQAAIAAFLRLGNGYPKSRSYVASRMDVTEQTVSNYCNRIRWAPADEATSGGVV